MNVDRQLLAPCGLYCGVCNIRIAYKDNNEKFKEKISVAYGLTPDKIRCNGCFSNDVFELCQLCPIKSCTKQKNIDGCHLCDEFPCQHVENFPVPVAKKVMMRSVPLRRELGAEKWVEAEEKRYTCPSCKHRLFRGVRRCNFCKTEVDLD